MVDEIATRPSMSVGFKIAESVGGSIKRFVAAGMVFTPGLIIFMHEMGRQYACEESLHSRALYTGVGLMIAGAIVVQPSVGKQFSGIFVTVFPNGLPMLGGRRQADPPAVIPTSTEDKTNG